MKKIAAMLLVLGLAASIGTGCGNKGAASSDANQPKTKASATEEKAEPEETSSPGEDSELEEVKTEDGVAGGADEEYNVEIDMMGENVPVAVIISDGGKAFKFSYEFKGNAIEADGIIGEDGTWTVENDASGFAGMVAPDIQAAVAEQ